MAGNETLSLYLGLLKIIKNMFLLGQVRVEVSFAPTGLGNGLGLGSVELVFRKIISPPLPSLISNNGRSWQSYPATFYYEVT